MFKKLERITRLLVPDEEIKNWTDTLKENGFSDEQIDMIMLGLNGTRLLHQLAKVFEDEMAAIIKTLPGGQDGASLDPEQYKTLQKYVMGRIHAAKLSDLKKRKIIYK